MQPLHDLVLIAPKKQEKQIIEGIVHLEDANLLEGTVLRTGKGRKGEPMILETGDEVIYPKVNKGFTVAEGLIISQNDIIALTGEKEVE